MAKATKVVVTPPQGDKPAEVTSVKVDIPPQSASVGQPAGVQGQQVELVMPPDVTAENWNTFTKEQLIQKFGNISNTMRGLVQLGIKPGPISKHLDKRYQHVRNVTTRTLKRQDAARRRQSPSAGSNQPVSVGQPANPKGGGGTGTKK